MNQTAQNLASYGRNGDTTLVHMSPQEVSGLQALARNNGTTMTINPHTGLPEAFSLGRLLPMIVGAGLNVASGGALSPLTAGLITGGLGAVATGSLREGLMMGLGAAGGAGLAGSATNLAAPAVVPSNVASFTPASANAAQTAVTNLGNNAANFAGAGSNPFSTNAAFNSPITTTAITPATTSMVAPPISGPMSLDPALVGRPVVAGPEMIQPSINNVTLGRSDLVPNAYTVGDPASTTNFSLRDRLAALQNQSPARFTDSSTGLESFNPNYVNQNALGPISRPPFVDSSTTGLGSLPSDVNRVFPSGSETIADSGVKALGDTGQAATPSRFNFETLSKNYDRAKEGFGKAFESMESAGEFLGNNKMNLAMSAAPVLFEEPEPLPEEESYIRPYTLDVENTSDRPASASGREEQRLRYKYTAGTPYKVAQGGIIAFAQGGNTPDGQEMNTNPAMMRRMDEMQVPPFAGIMDPSRMKDIYGMSGQGYAEGGETGRREVRKKINRMDDPYVFAAYQSGRGLYDAALQNFASGGLSNVPRFLSGGGDGMSDSIPASINDRQPARLADGEFVVPADVVSHLGNGSSKAGAKQLYAMMDRVRAKRTGKKKQAPAVNPKKMMPV